MRKVWVLAIAMVVSVAQCQVQYFPKSSLDSGGDGFKAHWYSLQLRALEEPSLFRLADIPASESYRFLWLRTFNHPISIRIDLKPDGTGILTTKIANGAGGYSPGALIENSSRTLKAEEVRAFLFRVERVGFWKARNPVNDQRGTDGSQWVIEGVKKGKYHVVDRWSPSGGVAHDLGLMLAFDLAKVDVPENEIY